MYRLTDYDRGDLVSGSISNATLTQDWTLDETGNWTAFDQGVAGSVDQTRSHNKANEITDIDETGGASWPTPTYDANGNMTSMPQPASLASGYDATWDAWNRLVKLEDSSNVVAEYQYDGLNRRIIRKIYAAGTLDHTRHLYLSSQNQVLEERIDSSTDAAQQFVWGIRFVDDLVLRDRDTNSDGTLNERLYALHDMRFSILAITNSSGTVQERFVYSAFGTPSIFSANYDARSSSSYDWEYRYTGRRHDLESKLHYFRARYYHAELGGFVSRDPLGYVDGMSLYRGYFIPREMDPSGMSTIDNDVDRQVDCFLKCVNDNEGGLKFFVNGAIGFCGFRRCKRVSLSNISTTSPWKKFYNKLGAKLGRCTGIGRDAGRMCVTRGVIVITICDGLLVWNSIRYCIDKCVPQPEVPSDGGTSDTCPPNMYRGPDGKCYHYE